MRVSLIAVAHHSAGVLPAAVESFRAAATAAGVRPEVVVVDHSEDAREAERLRAARPDRLLVNPNRGFAAGINAGVEVASGDVLLLANPDLRFLDGSVAALLSALDEWAVVGPQFELAGFLFPPADRQAPSETLGRAWAERSARAWRRRLRFEAWRWRRVWSAAAPVRVSVLSGALLALHAAVAEELGPLDEGYFLYFEETEWLRGIARAGLRMAVVPAARVEHRWGHTASPSEQAARYAESRQRFLRRNHRWSGPWADRLAGRLSRGFVPPPLGPVPCESPGSGKLEWLISASPRLLPAAAIFAEEPPRQAFEQFRSLAPVSTLYAAALDPATAAVYGPWAVS